MMENENEIFLSDKRVQNITSQSLHQIIWQNKRHQIIYLELNGDQLSNA